MISGSTTQTAREEELMRLDIKVTTTLAKEIARLAKKERIPVSRMAGAILARALGIKEDDALPPVKPIGRPSKALSV